MAEHRPILAPNKEEKTMQSQRISRAFGAASAVVAVTLIMVSSAWPQTYKILHAFKNPADGQQLLNLTLDAAGNLYGTTYTGGAYGYGTVFELTPNADGSWSETVLHSFSGPDGYWPQGNLIFDAAGNLYGTTQYGGDPTLTCEWGYSYGCGTVFKLAHNLDGSWTESVLYAFQGGNDYSSDGWDILNGLVFDSAGNLYGLAALGGSTTWEFAAIGQGEVFKLAPNLDGSWTKSTLHAFNLTDGFYPWGTHLIADAAGNLYGTTSYGGQPGCAPHGEGCGVVFEMTPNTDGTWTEKVIHRFDVTGKGLANPSSWLVFDASGDLYGTTFYGGNFGNGSVFELVPNASGGWTELILHNFTGGKDGANPFAGLVLDGAGNLYGTATGGGVFGYGTVFELTPKPGGVWTERVLHTFKSFARSPYPGVILDAAGNLYGATWAGANNGGVVFEITP
jgi:uncharacterized repeat protein (TIGR03803 family)